MDHPTTSTLLTWMTFTPVAGALLILLVVGLRSAGALGKAAADQAVPGRVTAKLRMEKTGRGRKVVTVVYDLPRNAAFLKALMQELKRSCGTGGTATDDTVELQGDLRDRVRELLLKKGFSVKS